MKKFEKFEKFEEKSWKKVEKSCLIILMPVWVKAKLAEAIVSKTIALGGSNPLMETKVLGMFQQIKSIKLVI